MRITTIAIAALCGIALLASDAVADEYTSNRDVQSAVDSYLATASEDARLVGGAGSAGYDAGFWIRGGDFLLRINATIQARYEAWDWDDEDLADGGGAGDGQGVFAGDTSGFSLPRMTLKFSGEAPCNICWYVELEFGHFGRDVIDAWNEYEWEEYNSYNLGPAWGPYSQTNNFDNTREAWIEWCYCPAFNFRMGQVRLPTTRQMMTAPELQQFIDVSYASAMLGWWLPGYTDRNRDHGLLVHGAFGCNNEWSYVVSVTNGDGGDSVRNVLDHRTSDNLALGGRLNWAFLAPIGYEEGALRQQTCQWYGEAGAWGFYYADRYDKSHETAADTLAWGLDLALGYGGFSFTSAYNVISLTDYDDGSAVGEDFTMTMWLVQLGYHFPGTAWEIAARASSIDSDNTQETGDGSLLEYAFGVNYYLNGHGNKLQLDVAFMSAQDEYWGLFGTLPGYQQWGFEGENKAVLIRFQWQLAL